MSESVVQTLLQLWKLGDETTAPGSLFHVWPPSDEEPLPDTQCDPPEVQVQAISSGPVAPFPLWENCRALKPPFSLLGWTNHKTSATPHVFCPVNPSPSLQPPFGHFNCFSPSLYFCTQNCTQYPRWGCTRAKQSAEFFSLNLSWALLGITFICLMNNFPCFSITVNIEAGLQMRKQYHSVWG